MNVPRPVLTMVLIVALGGCATTPSDVPPGPVYDAKWVTQPALILYRPKPELPERLRKRGIEGYVMVDVIIGSDGRIHSPNVVMYDVHSLIGPALENLAQTRFRPALVGGQPVNSRFQFVINFGPDRRPPADPLASKRPDVWSPTVQSSDPN